MEEIKRQETENTAENAEVSPQANNEAQPEKTTKKRVLTGRVTSNKPDKTIVVTIDRQVAHPIYKKYYKQSKKFMAHDPNNDCNEGDTVKIREHRPLSRHKRWELVEIIERAK